MALSSSGDVAYDFGDSAPTELAVDLPQGRIEGLTGGWGPPVLVLHRELAKTHWGELHAQLARSFAVVSPSLPGDARGPLAEWARRPAELATVVWRMVDELQVEDLCVVGLGAGGWVAAEMMAQQPDRMAGAVLIAPTGIQPRAAGTMDEVLRTSTAFALPGHEGGRGPLGAAGGGWGGDPWEAAYSRALPHLLQGVAVPTLLVRGRDDRHGAASVVEAYGEVLADARVTQMPGLGSRVELDHPVTCAALCAAHLRASDQVPN